MKPQKLANNKYKYVKRYYHPKLGKHKRVSVTLDRDTPQARNRAEVILQSRIDEILSYTEFEDKTFAEVAEEWIAFKKNKVSVHTFVNYNGNIQRHISKSKFYHYKMSQITTHDVQKFLDEQMKEYKPATVRLMNRVINYVMKYGYKVFGISSPYVNTDIEIGRMNDSKGSMIFTEKEIELINDKLLSKSIFAIHYDMFNFLLLTGMRAGEASVITIDDFKDGKITINKTYNKYYETRVQPFTKTHSSNRVISSSKAIEEIVHRRMKHNRIAFGDDCKFVFAVDKNTPMNYNSLTPRMKSVDERFSPHWCRHTHISLLAENGFTLKQIMNRVGHTQPNTTLKIYTEVTERLKESEYDKLDGLL